MTSPERELKERSSLTNLSNLTISSQTEVIALETISRDSRLVSLEMWVGNGPSILLLKSLSLTNFVKDSENQRGIVPSI